MTSTGARVLKNTTVLMMGQVTNMVCMTLWTIIVARYVGPEFFGIYGVAQSGVAILLVFVNLGLDGLAIREVARRPDKGPQYLVTNLAIKSVLVLVFLGGYVLFGHFQGWSADRMTLTAIVAGNGLWTAVSGSIGAILQARERMHLFVVGWVANVCLTLLTGAVLIWLRQPFSLILLLSFTASFVQVVIMLGFAFHLYPSFGLKGWFVGLDLRSIVGTLSQSMSFTALTVIMVLSNNVPLLLLDALVQDRTEVGYFAVAQRIYTMALVLPQMLNQALFPTFSRLYLDSPFQFAGAFERSYRFVFLLTVPMSIGLWVISPELLVFLFGRNYAPASAILQVLSLSLLDGVGYVLGPALVAMNRQSQMAVLSGVSVVGVVLFGFFTVPIYGAIGVSWALTFASTSGLVVYNYLLFRNLGIRYPVRWVGKTLVASTVMGVLTIGLVARIHFLTVTLVLSPLIYLSAILLLRVLSPHDVVDLKSLFPAHIRERGIRLRAWVSALSKG